MSQRPVDDDSTDDPQQKPPPVRWMCTWFLACALVGGLVTELLRDGPDRFTTVFAALVWGAVGVALSLSVRAGDLRPRGRRTRW